MDGKRGSSSSSSASSFRLSPSALPFTINRSFPPPNSNLLPQSSLRNFHPPTPFVSSVLESFSSPSLEGVDPSIGAPLTDCYGHFLHHSNNAFAAFSNDHPLDTNPYYPHYPSAAFHDNSPFAVHSHRSDFDALSATSIAIPLDEASRIDCPQHSSALGHTSQRNGVWNGLSYGEQRSFSCIENNGGASSADKTFLKQGVPAAEGLQTCLVTCANGCGKCTGIVGRDNQFGSRGDGQIDAESFSFPPENPNAPTSKISRSSLLCSAAIPQEVAEHQVPYPVLFVNSFSHGNENNASYERCVSKLYSYTANPPVSHSSENNSFPAQVFRSSGVKNNENYSGYTASSLKGSNVHQNAKGNEVYRDESMIDKGKSSLTNKDKFSGEKSVSGDAMDPLLIEKSELRVTHSNLLNDFTYEPHCFDRGVSIEKSCEMSDKYDSDVDSPCWKGTVACHSPVESGAVNLQQLKNELETCKGLNILAPQFFPGNPEGDLDYHGNECSGLDLFAFQKNISSVVESLSKEHGLRDTVEAGSCPSGVSSGVGAQCFDDIHEPKKECATLLNNSNSTSEINSSHMVKPSVMDDYFSYKGKCVIASNVSDSVTGIKDGTQNGSSCMPFLSTEDVSGVPFSGVIVPNEIAETFWGPFNSISTPPNIDIQVVVNALHNLSEFLMQNCSTDFDSLKEDDQDILQHVISNLYLCIRKRTLVSKTPHPGTSCCHRKLTDLNKAMGKGL